MKTFELITSVVCLGLSAFMLFDTKPDLVRTNARESAIVSPAVRLHAGGGSFFAKAVCPPGCCPPWESMTGGDPLERAALWGRVLTMAGGKRTDAADRAVWDVGDWTRWYASTLAAEHVPTVGHTMAEGSRVDILTRWHAFAVCHAGQWGQGVGRALFYAAATHKAPALLLLLHRGDDHDRRDYLRALIACHAHKITLIAVRIPPETGLCRAENPPETGADLGTGSTHAPPRSTGPSGST